MDLDAEADRKIHYSDPRRPKDMETSIRICIYDQQQHKKQCFFSFFFNDDDFSLVSKCPSCCDNFLEHPCLIHLCCYNKMTWDWVTFKEQKFIYLTVLGGKPKFRVLASGVWWGLHTHMVEIEGQKGINPVSSHKRIRSNTFISPF